MLCLQVTVSTSKFQILYKHVTYAIMLTSLLPTLASMSSLNTRLLSSIELEAGTVVVYTSIPCRFRASLIPLQYCTPGRYLPAQCNSSKPKRPCANTIGFLGASIYRQLTFLRLANRFHTVRTPDRRKIGFYCSIENLLTRVIV